MNDLEENDIIDIRTCGFPIVNEPLPVCFDTVNPPSLKEGDLYPYRTKEGSWVLRPIFLANVRDAAMRISGETEVDRIWRITQDISTNCKKL